MVVVLMVELEVTLLMLYPHQVYLLKTTLAQLFTPEVAVADKVVPVVLADKAVLADKVVLVELVLTPYMLEERIQISPLIIII